MTERDPIILGSTWIAIPFRIDFQDSVLTPEGEVEPVAKKLAMEHRLSFPADGYSRSFGCRSSHADGARGHPGRLAGRAAARYSFELRLT
jgi:hypothetical protein